LPDFVRITATAPAQIYNLGPRKGSIAIGADADLVVWDADRAVTYSDDEVKSAAGFNPWAGRTVRAAPERVVRRGQVIVEDGACTAVPGSGRFLARSGGAAARPRGVPSGEYDTSRNFGARLDE
jgi:dihydropyrimidinase